MQHLAPQRGCWAEARELSEQGRRHYSKGSSGFHPLPGFICVLGGAWRRGGGGLGGTGSPYWEHDVDWGKRRATGGGLLSLYSTEHGATLTPVRCVRFVLAK